MSLVLKLSLASELHGISDALHWLVVGAAIAVAAVLVDWLTRRRV